MEQRCTFQQLKKLLSDEGYSTSVGDEGGFSTEVNNVHDALYFVSKAVKKAGRNLVDEINLLIKLHYIY